MLTHLPTPRTPASRRPVPATAGPRQWLGLVVLMLPVLLVSIDTTVLSFALPQISVALTPTADQLLWVVDVYPLMLAGLLVTMGVLGDRLGRRRLLLVGAAGFGLVSVLAAFATDAGQLVAARALLGVFGATLMPSTLSLLRNLFLDDDQRRLAIAIWASGFAGGSVLGPVVGGWLLEHFWWGSIFLLNVPVLVVLLVAAPFLLPESRNPAAGRLDVPSVVLAVVGMLPLVYGIKTTVGHGPGALGLGALATGAALVVVFVRRQLRLAEPLLDVELFRRPVFAASVGANFTASFALAGLVLVVSQVLQLVVGLSPRAAGTALLPGAVASITAGLVAVRLVRVVPRHLLVPVGMLLAAAGYGLGALVAGDARVGGIVAVFALVGAGVGLAETLTNDAILASVPPERAGAASGISETSYELGASLGVAVLGSVVAAVYRADLTLPGTLDAAQADVARQTLGGAVAVADGLPDALGAQVLTAAQDAFSHGVGVTSAVAAVVLAGVALLVGRVLRRADRAVAPAPVLDEARPELVDAVRAQPTR
ncbi:MFS transporter [Cellulomonas sp. SLBN-39]|uniref:MFS transporter n=1 Tax=Cellulomonas sp. SLBN-39 TaxID=2768446 RepID=UPI001169D210|nr:MFS transporter [Cellulomonas sp. SLBN-39]TQL01733.1 DHA2 family multidrug resistance protein-like MFS transporter [Cellulomonas sp. SLBN-39]